MLGYDYLVSEDQVLYIVSSKNKPTNKKENVHLPLKVYSSFWNQI